jgi:hypothetical protein
LYDLSKMSQIQDLLKCAICKEIFTGTPVILPCCYKTVCEHHIENQDESVASKKRKLFTCILCEASHDQTKCKKFASNETIEKLLKIDNLANLGDIYVQTNNQLKLLERNFSKVNNLISDPKNFIFDEISALKRDVDLRKEKFKHEIDEICAEMIAKLDKYQQDCYENIQSLKLEENSSDTLLEVQKYLDEWTKDNKKLLIVSNDSKRKEIQSKAKELDMNLFDHYESLKEELTMNRYWFYEKNEIVVDISKNELMQFEE